MTETQPTEPSSNALNERIISRLGLARDRLIDKNLRNRLISANLNSSRSKSLRVFNNDSAGLFGHFHKSKKGMGFEVADDLPLLEQQEGEFADAPVSDRQSLIKTKLTKEGLQKKLKSLYFESREYEEEQGVNILYLALGFIKWYESEVSDVERFAPVILLPVELVRDGARDKYRLEPREDDLFENVSFKLWVKEQNDIELPELPDDDDWTLQSYFDSVRTAISKETRWSLLENEALLGFFSFNKFLLWRDLQPENWPSADLLLQHPIVKELLMPPMDGSEPDAPIVPPDEKIDDHFTPADLVYVVDADSSQTEAIQTVLAGRNVVIQGPPGTGKSQTITNIISAAVSKGWKVLFIAEKMAALEVVESRLDGAGLGVMCLQLHSRKSTKAAVLEQIRESIDYPGTPPGLKNSLQPLIETQKFLNKHAARINTPMSPWNFTPYEVLGEIEKAQRLGLSVFNLQIPAADAHTRESLESLSESLEQLANRLQRSGVPSRHPWRQSSASVFTPMDLENLRRAVLALAEARLALQESILELNSRFSLSDDGVAIFRRDDWDDLFARAKKISIPDSVGLLTRDSELLRSSLNSLRTLKEQLSTYQVQSADVERWLIKDWEKEDIRGIRTRLASSGGSLFSIFNSLYRASIADFKGIAKGKLPEGFRNRLALLDKAMAVSDSKSEIFAFNKSLAAELGNVWANERTNTDVLERLIAWFELCLPSSEISSALIRRLGCDASLLTVFQTHETAVENFFARLKSFAAVASIPESELLGLSARELCGAIESWDSEVDRFNEWPTVRVSLEGLRDVLGDSLIQKIWNGEIQAQHIELAVRFCVMEAIWRKLSAAEPELSNIDALRLDTELRKFRELDRNRLKESAHQVLSSYTSRAPKGNGGEMAVVRQELVKKRNIFPVRKLLNKAGRAIQELKPVFLMSPLSVAQFVSPGNLIFDLVLIDEASQVRPEDAIGAIARSRQVVVVGDSKQLPPTNFFSRLVDEQDATEVLDDDGAYFLNDVESILGLCDGVFRSNMMLRWHYRSLHPGLIAVSNRNFYDGKLFLPPSVLRDSYSDGLGVSFVKSPQNGYVRGGSEGGRNLLEAELIAKQVIEFAKNFPEKTLGVAAFSVTQRDAIRDLIDEHRRKNPSTEAFFSVSRKEPFFVKNLESIQGDERDVIFISVGYGRTEDGRLTQTFGPLSVEGGERRLNVLISRAKERCTVFSSITSEDVKPVPGRLGVNAFREFLQFAEKGYFDVPESTERGFDSDFEESVAVFLMRNGFKVQPQVGMSGFYIDIGVVHPKAEGRFICGIECDGATYHSSRSARDRDRLRQQILESRGWNIYRIWSTDWFHRRHQQEMKLLDHLNALVQGLAVDATDDEIALPPEVIDAPMQPLVDAPPASSESTSVSAAYLEFSGRFTISGALHEVPTARLVQMVNEIVSIEGPIHQEEVARRLARSCGLEKAGNRIQAATLKALRASSTLRPEGVFWSTSDSSKLVVRNRSGVGSRTLLLPENLPPAEIALALVSVVCECVRIEELDLIQSAARMFGFQRVGPDIKRIFLDSIMSHGAGLVRESDGFIALGHGKKV